MEIMTNLFEPFDIYSACNSYIHFVSVNWQYLASSAPRTDCLELVFSRWHSDEIRCERIILIRRSLSRQSATLSAVYLFEWMKQLLWLALGLKFKEFELKIDTLGRTGSPGKKGLVLWLIKNGFCAGQGWACIANCLASPPKPLVGREWE